MKMSDEEWAAKYMHMAEDRKYPVAVPGLAVCSISPYPMKCPSAEPTTHIVKLALTPVLGLLTLRNFDVVVDIYRQKYVPWV